MKRSNLTAVVSIQNYTVVNPFYKTKLIIKLYNETAEQSLSPDKHWDIETITTYKTPEEIMIKETCVCTCERQAGKWLTAPRPMHA